MLLQAAQYLTYAEAVTLYQQLHEAGVPALVKSCGPPTFPFGEGKYYQLLIEEADTTTAQVVVEAFEQQRTTPAAPRCPRCGTPDPVPVSRPTWWKRLFYAGTTLHKCRSCDAEFPR
ncbi:hypothetical protein DNI29_17275 [Hymenobacter sediminis]|uniref:hypothetical protein n=1 Tax=Hymenobacter sediminis TaxID=2218621 RepID=UPI000DA6CEC6|nr:hypothetical protein [Hymenobacter sediminis]RPD45899.1 hypothetical protein DNI29_17275 [Hymenobacter sediminis]